MGPVNYSIIFVDLGAYFERSILVLQELIGYKTLICVPKLKLLM